jgi:putative transposase
VMAAAKRLSPEQIVAKLREAERLQGQGATIPQVCKKLGCAEQTFYRWRRMYGSMKEDEAIRLKTLEQENARLKRIVAEQTIDISMLKHLTRGNFSPRLAAGRPSRTS